MMTARILYNSTRVEMLKVGTLLMREQMWTISWYSVYGMRRGWGSAEVAHGVDREGRSFSVFNII